MPAATRWLPAALVEPVPLADVTTAQLRLLRFRSVRSSALSAWFGSVMRGVAARPGSAQVAGRRWVCSLVRFSTVAASFSSASAAVSPRRLNRRSRVLSLRCPKTGSMVAARRR